MGKQETAMAGLFFFAKKDQNALNKSLTDKLRKLKNYKDTPLSSGFVVLIEQAATPAKPAATPPNAWTGRIPFTTRKSTLLGAQAPPPCATDAAAILFNTTRTFKIFKSRSLHHTAPGTGTRRTTPPTRRERSKDGRSAAGLHRSTDREGEDHRLQKPLRPRHQLPSAAG